MVLKMHLNHHPQKQNNPFNLAPTKQTQLNWILLIIAGLFEVAFATCLGKAKEATGMGATYWYVGFLLCLAISMFLLVKVTQELPFLTSLLHFGDSSLLLP